MINLFSQINNIDYAVTGAPLTPEAIKQTSDELQSCNLPSLPPEVISFLKVYNGFMLEERCIWGINNSQHFLYDILAENLDAAPPPNLSLLLLGATETTYIGWLQSEKRYAMIDKTTFMMLHKFNNFAEAVKYILKIDD